MSEKERDKIRKKVTLQMDEREREGLTKREGSYGRERESKKERKKRETEGR